MHMKKFADMLYIIVINVCEAGSLKELSIGTRHTNFIKKFSRKTYSVSQMDLREGRKRATPTNIVRKRACSWLTLNRPVPQSITCGKKHQYGVVVNLRR